MDAKYIIRTSDRLTFLKCRQLWDFSSKIRQNWEPLRAKDYIDMGLAWHSALETWYNPTTWELPPSERQANALQAFNFARAEQLRAYVKAGVDDAELDRQFAEDTQLGELMLNNYASWSVKNDNFAPVFVEKEFEVPIKDESGCPIYKCINGLWIHGTDVADKCDIPIVYQGRIDGLVKDPSNNYWILEHKTTSQFGGTNWLAMDDQVGSYIWALREMLNINIRGVIHTSTLKRAPEAPKKLKSGMLSVDKRQATDLLHYLAAINEQHPTWAEEQVEIQYGEMLKYLESPAAPVFIRRLVIDRSQEMIDDIGERIYHQAREMLSDPNIYPSISPMNCNGCAFYAPCLAKQDKSDVKFMLESSFKRRDSSA